MGPTVLAGCGVMGSGPRLRIVYLYPDLMNLYADWGNVVCLRRRCEWRGIVPDIRFLEWDQSLDQSADLYVIGGGQDRQQVLASKALLSRTADQILSDLGAGAGMLAVCGGYQLMARWYRTADGSQLKGLGVFDAETVHPGPDVRRCIGNVVCEWGSNYLVGFENHGGRTYLGPHAEPLGRVVCGHGNNSEDGTEGAITDAAIGTYLHGPVLPKNPHLADHLIASALARAAPGAPMGPLNDEVEWAAHRSALRVAGVGKRDA